MILSIGSSPRAWGILAPTLKQAKRIWFIPTCVGNTYKKVKQKIKILVHPHVRGEYSIAGILVPPAIWFIPTCVGNTGSYTEASQKNMVHPHVRGEYLLDNNAGIIRIGSSPRAWGIRGTIIDVEMQFRFIPTCVGNTSKAASDY